MRELYEFAVELAERAGEITLRYFRPRDRGRGQGRRLAGNDRRPFGGGVFAAEIEKRFPEDGILGEEFGEKPGRSGRRWTIDPIDGTKSLFAAFRSTGR
jgi:histidinol-phosphatase